MPTRWKVLFGVLLTLAGLPGCGGGKAGSSGGTPVSSSGRLALVSSQSGVFVYRVDGSGGLTVVAGSPFAMGNGPASLWALPAANFAYVANQGENDISLMKINNSTGSLTEITPRTPTGINPSSLAMDSGGSFLYVANDLPNLASISVFSVSSSTGTLTPVSNSPFPAHPDPRMLLVSPTGKYLFVLNPDLSAISVYTISSGALQEVMGSPFGVGHTPTSVVVDSAEHFLYVANEADSTLSIFAIQSTGSLTPVLGSPFTTTLPPNSMVLNTSGGYLYVSSTGSTDISAFALDSNTGLPTAIVNSPFTASSTPSFLVIAPSNTFLLEADQTAKTISTLPITAGTGALGGVSISTTVPFAPQSIFVTK